VNCWTLAVHAGEAGPRGSPGSSSPTPSWRWWPRANRRLHPTAPWSRWSVTGSATSCQACGRAACAGRLRSEQTVTRWSPWWAVSRGGRWPEGLCPTGACHDAAAPTDRLPAASIGDADHLGGTVGESLRPVHCGGPLFRGRSGLSQMVGPRFRGVVGW